MKTLARIAAPFLRAVGFLVMLGSLFYFLVYTFTSGIRESWLSGVIFLISLAAIFGGDRLKAWADAGEAPAAPPADGSPQAPKAELLDVVAAGVLSLLAPGVGQAYNGQLVKGAVFGAVVLAIPAVLYWMLLVKPGAIFGWFGLAGPAVYCIVGFIALLDAAGEGWRMKRDGFSGRWFRWKPALVFAAAFFVVRFSLRGAVEALVPDDQPRGPAAAEERLKAAAEEKFGTAAPAEPAASAADSAAYDELFAKGIGLIQEKKYEDAAVPLVLATQRKRDSAGAHLALAIALLEARKKNVAVVEYAKALQLEPRYKEDIFGKELQEKGLIKKKSVMWDLWQEELGVEQAGLNLDRALSRSKAGPSGAKRPN